MYMTGSPRFRGDRLCPVAELNHPLARPGRLARHRGARFRHSIRCVVGILAISVHCVIVMALMLGVPLPKPQGATSMVMIDLTATEQAAAEPRPVPKSLPKDIEPLFVSAPLPQAISIDYPPSVSSAAPAVHAPPATQNAASMKAEWAARVLQHLEHFKRYPREAAAQHAQGTAYVHFSIDRSGAVLRARIDRGAGYDLLDEAALALVRQATPLPPPPQQLEGDVFDLVVPITFSLEP